MAKRPVSNVMPNEFGMKALQRCHACLREGGRRAGAAKSESVRGA